MGTDCPASAAPQAGSARRSTSHGRREAWRCSRPLRRYSAFEEWECSLGRTHLAPGDLLVAYSDGITEASRGEEQYGEARLVQVARDHAHRSVEDIATAILGSVQEVGVGEQSDDLTLMIARAR